MKILVIISVIVLGLEVLRLVIGGIAIIFTGKALGIKKRLSIKMRLFNLLEMVLIAFAYTYLIIYLKI